MWKNSSRLLQKTFACFFFIEPATPRSLYRSLGYNRFKLANHWVNKKSTAQFMQPIVSEVSFMGLGMVFSFNLSVITWHSVLSVDESGENQRPVASPLYYMGIPKIIWIKK